MGALATAIAVEERRHLQLVAVLVRVEGRAEALEVGIGVQRQSLQGLWAGRLNHPEYSRVRSRCCLKKGWRQRPGEKRPKGSETF